MDAMSDRDIEDFDWLRSPSLRQWTRCGRRGTSASRRPGFVRHEADQFVTQHDPENRPHGISVNPVFIRRCGESFRPIVAEVVVH